MENVLGVMVVEASNFSDIQFINTYHAGWLNFDRHPTSTGGVPMDSDEIFQASLKVAP